MQQLRVIFHGRIHALDVHVFRSSRRNFKAKRREGSSLRDKTQKECENSGADSWFAILGSVLSFVTFSGEVIKEFLLVEVGRVAHDFLASSQQSHSRHL